MFPEHLLLTHTFKRRTDASLPPQPQKRTSPVHQSPPSHTRCVPPPHTRVLPPTLIGRSRLLPPQQPSATLNASSLSGSWAPALAGPAIPAVISAPYSVDRNQAAAISVVGSVRKWIMNEGESVSTFEEKNGPPAITDYNWAAFKLVHDTNLANRVTKDLSTNPQRTLSRLNDRYRLTLAGRALLETSGGGRRAVTVVRVCRGGQDGSVKPKTM